MVLWEDHPCQGVGYHGAMELKFDNSVYSRLSAPVRRHVEGDCFFGQPGATGGFESSRQR